jgi:hypothetical protein
MQRVKGDSLSASSGICRGLFDEIDLSQGKPAPPCSGKTPKSERYVHMTLVALEPSRISDPSFSESVGG